MKFYLLSLLLMTSTQLPWSAHADDSGCETSKCGKTGNEGSVSINDGDGNTLSITYKKRSSETSNDALEKKNCADKIKKMAENRDKHAFCPGCGKDNSGEEIPGCESSNVEFLGELSYTLSPDGTSNTISCEPNRDGKYDVKFDCSSCNYVTSF